MRRYGLKLRVRVSVYWWMFGINVVRLYEYSPEELKRLLISGEKGKVKGHKLKLHFGCVQLSFYRRSGG